MSRRPFAHAWKPAVRPAPAGARPVLCLKVRAPASSASSPARPRSRSPFSSSSALLSIGSWGIFLYKWWTFRRAARQSAQFLDVFRRSNKFSEVQAVCRSLERQPARRAVSDRLRRADRAAAADDAGRRRRTTQSTPPAGRPTLKSLPAVDRALLRASVVEVNKLEQHVSFLATTASIAPFIGLFGTVWGIMSAFRAASARPDRPTCRRSAARHRRSAGRDRGRPGRGDSGGALLQPLSQRVKLFASEMDDFAMEFLNIAERNFT